MKEQKLAITTCTDTIDSYMCLIFKYSYTKNINICGCPGEWENGVWCGELQISKVNPWKWTPILVNIDTFDIPLLTYAMIKPYIKRVPIPGSDTDV